MHVTIKMHNVLLHMVFFWVNFITRPLLESQYFAMRPMIMIIIE